MTDHDRLEPPPVEPISDVSWARIERGLWARMDATATAVEAAKRVRVWPWLVTPLVAAAAAAAIILAVRRTPAPASSPVATDVEEPTRLVAGAAPSSMSLGDAHITLDAYSAVVVSQNAGSPTALLERGAAWFSIGKRGERPPFIVLAGDTRVRVIGTKFRVARSDERSEVTVEHGVVEVQFHGTVTRVAAHQTWSSEHPASVADSTVSDVEVDNIEIDPATHPIPVRAPKHHTAAPTIPAPGSSAPSGVPSDRVRYEALTKIEATHPEVAMKGYLDLSQGSGEWAEVALFAACSLAVDRHDARAEMFLTIYLKRFPNGKNAADAAAALSRIKGAP